MTSSRTFTVTFTVTVDDEDADLLDKLDERMASQSSVQRFAYNALRLVSENGYKGLHRAILARQGFTYGHGQVADHIDRNTGNNRRNNLRVVTTRQNRLNTKLATYKVSTYNGVSWNPVLGQWVAKTTVLINGRSKTHRMGSYAKEEDAAKAYDKYVWENNLDKTLNFPV